MQKVTPIQFFKILFGEPVGPGGLVIWTRSSRGRSAGAYWPKNLDEAARQAYQYRKSRDVYFCLAPQNRNLALEIARRRRPRANERHLRGSEPSATLLPALWAEIVAAGPAAGGCLPSPDPEAVMAVLAAFDRRPSIVIDTGAGFQVYWLLREPLLLATGEARRAARRLLLKLQAALATAAAEHGLRVDPCPDPAAMLRVPGTLNHTFQPAVEVTVERFPLALDGGRVWTPEDFDQLPEPGPDAGLEALMRDPGAEGDRGPAADFLRVYGGCPFLQYCYQERAGLPESEWQAALDAVVECRLGDADGRRLGHRYSRDHLGYTVSATDAEIDLALFSRQPSTCRQIAELGVRAAACCAGCAHRGRIEGPIALGRPPAPPAGSRDVDLPAGLAAPDLAVAGATAAVPAVVTPEPAPGRPQMVIASWQQTAGGAPEGVRTTLVWIGAPPHAGDPDAGEPVATGPAGPATSRDRGAAMRRPAALPPGLLDGLGELLEALGGAASSREILSELARPPRGGEEPAAGRYQTLRSALAELFPTLDAEALPTPAQLSARLRSLRGRGAGGARIERGARGYSGVRWSIRRAEEASP